MRLQFFIALCGFLLTQENRAQQTSAEMQETMVLDHVALQVADLQRSAVFYSEVLGLKEIANRTQQPGMRWFSLGQGRELHLISTVSDPLVHGKANHFALKARAFDALLERLKALNQPFADWEGNAQSAMKRADGVRQIYLKDPDGNWIEVNEWLQAP